MSEEQEGRLLAVKIAVARSQLSAALELFLRGKDPVAVHCLACGGGEILDQVADKLGEEPFSTAILKSQPVGLNRAQLVAIRNRYWNAFKHLTARDGQMLRMDDIEIIEQFNDMANDAVLFSGWHDYMLATKRLPIAAQVFQLWWYGVYTHKMAPNADMSGVDRVFPEIAKIDRLEQKRRLRRAVEKWDDNKPLLGDPKTEPSLSTKPRT
jgi:hypothetical protein